MGKKSGLLKVQNAERWEGAVILIVPSWGNSGIQRAFLSKRWDGETLGGKGALSSIFVSQGICLLFFISGWNITMNIDFWG